MEWALLVLGGWVLAPWPGVCLALVSAWLLATAWTWRVQYRLWRALRAEYLALNGQAPGG